MVDRLERWLHDALPLQQLCKTFWDMSRPMPIGFYPCTYPPNDHGRDYGHIYIFGVLWQARGR